MAMPQTNVLNMPGMGDDHNCPVGTMWDGQQCSPVEGYMSDGGTGTRVSVMDPVIPLRNLPPRVTPGTIPAPAQTGLNLGFLSNPINLPLFGNQPLWLVLLGAAGIWFFVLPMLSEHKGRGRK